MNGVLLAGRYRIQECIGRGGMGRVWRARDEVLHRTVAVKELTAALYAAERDRPVLLDRTRAEARAAARITHPAVVTVHDVLEHDERPWIVMELVEGGSLADAIQERGRVDAERSARTGLWVARALRAAHEAGVLHRDVKPANVLLAEDGRVLLTDFGIAQVDGDSGMTKTGEIVGSVDYLAPERVRGGEPGAAADLWALGATLYTAVEGVSPFRRPSALGTFQAVVDEEPAPPAHAGPLAPVIAALLRKDPEARPDAEEVERMLAEAAEGRWPVETGPAAGYTPTRPVDPAALAALAAAPAPVEPAAPPAPGRPGGSGAAAALSAAPTTSTPMTSTPLPPPPPAAPAHTPPAPTPLPAPSAPARRPGWYGVLAGAAAVVVLSVGGALVLRYVDQERKDTAAPTVSASPSHEAGAPPADPRTPATNTPAKVPEGGAGTPSAVGSPTPAVTADGADTVPAGWTRVTDPTGFSLAVPQGWERTVTNGQIDYTPDGGERLLRIGVVTQPDFDSSYTHLLDLESQLSSRLTDYTRADLRPNTFRDRPGAHWEFSWISGGSETAPGPRRAIEQAYISRDGVEYAIYMSGPEADWPTLREHFRTVLGSWREQPDGT
ncbi:serine/threonine-protein kinase [Streptomyces sp. NPDC002490]|uniref:serine/threonine-protein kinase n=1 Tax=Streptomyces sp. NPDC002490 TaxID=3154416 RepID=UPI00332F7ABB